MIIKFAEGFINKTINKAIKNVTLRHCIQYEDDEKNGDTVTCRKLEFKNFHDYKKYRPSDCNQDMVNFFVKGVGTGNKRKTTKGIIREMKNGTCDSPYVFNKRDSTKDIETSRIIKLKKQQKLVPRIINPQTNLKGLLVYHGLGSGKTGTSIIVAEACKHIMTNLNNISKGSDRSQNRVLVVVPASLKEQYKKEILGTVVAKSSGFTKEQYVEVIKEAIEQGLNLSLFNEEKFIKKAQRFSNKIPKVYNSFSTNVLINGEKQNYLKKKTANLNYPDKISALKFKQSLLAIVNKTFTVISRQSFMRNFLLTYEKFEEGELKSITKPVMYIKNYLKNPNGLLIIDEIQNLISETGSWYKKLSRGLKYYCHPTTKILLLTATPIYDKTFELGLTINLLNPRIRFPETKYEFEKLFVANSSIELNEEHKRTGKKDVEERKNIFMDHRGRLIKFAQMFDPEITEFKNVTPTISNKFTKYQKIYKKLNVFYNKIPDYELFVELQDEYIEEITEIKECRANIGKDNVIKKEELKDYIDCLKKMLFLNEYKNSTIKNRDMFEYMCSGYISYFKGGNPKGFPKKITKIIDCRMKGAQADRYNGIVKKEIKQNEDAELSQSINPNSTKEGTYFQKACMYSNVNLIYTKQTNLTQEEIKKEKRKLKESLLTGENNPEEVINAIKSMSLAELQELADMKDSADIDTIHDKIYEEEGPEEKKAREVKEKEERMMKAILNIRTKSSKQKLKNLIELTSKKNKAYYEATLKVLRNEINNFDNDTQKLDYIDKKYSCKFAKMIGKIIEEENGKGKHFVYSRFKTRGVECLSYMLEGFGYKRYNEEEIKNLKKDVDKNKKLRGKCFTVWSGDIVDKVEFSKNFKSIYNNTDNRDGKYLKIVLGTESIMEGVDLKEVKYVHITEPWWNESRMDQVMGRAIRWKSHINMDPKDRKVIIYRYYALCDLDRISFKQKIQPLMSNELSIAITEQSIQDFEEREKRIIRENMSFSAHNKENPKPTSPLQFLSIDRYIQAVSEKKKRLNQMFYKSIKNSAIDCLFNKHGNTYRLESEYYYDERDNEYKHYYDPTEHKYYDMSLKEKKKDIIQDTLLYTDKYDTEEENKISGEKLNIRKIPRTNNIYRENIECNSSTKTGKIFEEVLQKQGMKRLLNNKQKEEIKQFLFNEIVYKSNEEQNQIKRRLKKCLLTKNINKDKFMKLMNKSNEEPSIRTKIINNIMSVLIGLEMKMWEESSDTLVTQNEIQNQRIRIEQESEVIRSGLYEESIDYLKQSEKRLKIDTVADEYSRDLIKKILDKAKNIKEKKSTIEQKIEQSSFYNTIDNNVGFDEEDFLLGGETEQDNIDAVNNSPH